MPLVGRCIIQGLCAEKTELSYGHVALDVPLARQE